MTLSPEVLAAAMQKVSRDIYWRPEPWMYSTLRASAPPQPRSLSDTDIVSTPPRSAPVAADGHVVAPVGATLPEVADAPGHQPTWQALLDVTVWRSRPWWLRVAASLVVKRLGR